MIESTGFQTRFGQAIANIEAHKDYLMNEIWRIKLVQAHVSTGFSYSVDQIRHFLSPYDQTVALLTKSIGSRQPRAEFTCEWFDSHLMSFIRGKDRNLLISGKTGIGKTTLTDWIVERLQRLQGAKASDVIFHKIRK